MSKEGSLIIFLFLISFISASCSENQVDINSASKEELMNLNKIGDAKAQAIIDYRKNNLFNSIEDIMKVSGIKEGIFGDIKNQICVDTEKETKEEEETDKDNEEEIENREIKVKEIEKRETKIEEETAEQEVKIEELPVIYLNSEVSKDIKTENNKENLRKNLSLYGVITFCVVFGMVFLIKQRKKRHGFE
jgi:competence protein ComEA